MMNDDEKRFMRMNYSEYGIGEYCIYCEHYNEYAFPRENDFEEFCSKKYEYIKDLELGKSCENFKIGAGIDE